MLGQLCALKNNNDYTFPFHIKVDIISMTLTKIFSDFVKAGVHWKKPSFYGFILKKCDQENTDLLNT